MTTWSVRVQDYLVAGPHLHFGLSHREMGVLLVERSVEAGHVAVYRQVVDVLGSACWEAAGGVFTHRVDPAPSVWMVTMELVDVCLGGPGPVQGNR